MRIYKYSVGFRIPVWTNQITECGSADYVIDNCIIINYSYRLCSLYVHSLVPKLSGGGEKESLVQTVHVCT